MSFTIKIESTPEAILKKRGLGPGGAAPLAAAEAVYELSAPYVPIASGALRQSGAIRPAGTGYVIEYSMPYAKYQYYGLSASGRPLVYRGASPAGPRWEERMAADRGHELAVAVAAVTGGRAL